jgi:pyruvate/2-oxoglutarate dehydrogenase complex dihydrolipoamide acyltransferase (E2) component
MTVGRHEIALPVLGDATSGEVTAWYKDSGASVTTGEPLVAVDVDKAVLDLPAPVSGVLTAVVDVGTEVHVGDLLGWITVDGAA